MLDSKQGGSSTSNRGGPVQDFFAGEREIVL